MFSFICALPSPASAGSCLPLFGRFTGTTAQSDFSSTCMSVVRLCAFTDRPSLTAEGALEISRFSCMLFPQRARALTTTQDRPTTRDNAAAVLPSSYSPGSRQPDLRLFEAQSPRPLMPPAYASQLTSRCVPQD